MPSQKKVDEIPLQLQGVDIPAHVWDKLISNYQTFDKSKREAIHNERLSRVASGDQKVTGGT